MMYSIYNTTDWPLQSISKYAPELTQAMVKMTERFPDDVSLEDMAIDIANGRAELWLILDDRDRFKAFLTTEVTITMTGKKRVTLCQLAGEGGAEIAQLINSIEVWAKSIGADEICPIGRLGWRKELAKYGYQPTITKYRKEL